MAYLLDVNVLIARTDPWHEANGAVGAWLDQITGERLLFCPLVENGFLRIYGHPNYPGGPGSPGKAAIDLHHMLELPNAEFVSEDLSIRDTGIFRLIESVTPRQLTDLYLLGLSVSKGARFATLDGRVPVDAVRGGSEALTVIA